VTRLPIRLELFGVFFVLAGTAFGQPAQTADRACASVGLVLSGGGARGAAHIGVLKVLEEMRVPVDYVAGTSMGAIVGGLYASGLSSGEIEVGFTATDWANQLNDSPPRRNIPFRRKQDDDEDLFKFEVGVGKKGILLPSGLVAGQKFTFLMRSLTLHTAGIQHFDELPIPFRAIASDLDGGEMVVLDSGDLAEALLASMAVPGAFAPVVVGGRTLVDGGVVRNLPVDVVQDMGADCVIAVDVSTPPQTDARNRSLIGVALQTFLVLSDQNVQEQRERLRDRDVLITPELDEIAAADFGRVEDAVAEGEAAARGVSVQLQDMQVSPERFQHYLDRRRTRSRDPGEIPIDSVRVVGNSRVDSRIVSRRIETRPGENLDLETLEGDLQRVYRIGEFQRVDFRLQRRKDGNHLIIAAEDKSWGPQYLRVGLGLEADFEGRGDFTAVAHHTFTHINPLGAEWKNIGKVGAVNSIFSEFYQPLTYSGLWFVAPQLEAISDESQFFDATGARTLAENEQLIARFDVGLQYKNYGEVRMGLEVGTLDAGLSSTGRGSDLLADIGGWRGSLTLDQLDNTGFPRHGTFLDADLFLSREALGADLSYDSLELRAAQAVSFGENTLVGRLELGNDFGSDIPFYREFRLGGFLNLSGFEPGQFQGDVLAYASLTYHRQVGRLPGGLGGGIYLGGSIEAGNVWQDTEQAELGDLRPAGTVFAGVDTVLGPAYLGYGRASEGFDSFYLFLGFPF
jgi:NTE family protein